MNTTTREYRGILIDDSRNQKLTEEGLEIIADRYLYPGEASPQEMFARVATAFSDDSAHAQRLYDYISNLWFMPATPVLSNGGTDRGLPISCFLSEFGDSMSEIWDTLREQMRLGALGGGLGTYWNLRSIGESVGSSGKTSGLLSFMKVFNSQVECVSQGSIRRGSAASYVRIDHPEIEEFIVMRKPSGGDPNRKCLFLHHGIVIPDSFMEAVAKNEFWAYRSPKTGEPLIGKDGKPRGLMARDLWSRILDLRMETGEPYLLFIDTVNRAVPEYHREEGLFVKSSNLCIEITLPINKERTAVCCLSSVNAVKVGEWSKEGIVELFFEDIYRMLDNVLSDFIKRSEPWPELKRAAYSAFRERSVGLGLMGFHELLQRIGIPFESELACDWNVHVCSLMRKMAERASHKLALEKGACPDAEKYGIEQRFTYKLAIAPTATISSICGGTSPSIDPWSGNAFTHKTLSGSFLIKNPALEDVLKIYGANTTEVWMSIINNNGSVQHLDFLTELEKNTFKTAYEIDQMWVVRHAGDRAKYIDQSVSTNFFFPATIDKKQLLKVHWEAWKRGVKSLYYCRSQALKQAHAVSNKVERVRIEESNHWIKTPLVELTVTARPLISISGGEATIPSADLFVCEACQ